MLVWFWQKMEEMPLPTNILILFLTFALVTFSFYPRKISKIVLLLSYVLLLILQIQLTRITTIFEYSGLEKSIIEQRPYNYLDPPQFYRFREYLFSSINFVNIFLSPLLILGTYSFIKKPIKLISILLIVSILLLATISPNGKYGPILLQPFIYYLIFYGYKLVKK